MNNSEFDSASESHDGKTGSGEKDVDKTEIGSIPKAKITSQRLTFGDLFRGSRFWWLTVACLILSAGLVWWSLPSKGIELSIHFPDGHGLEAEDSVQFRGIEVGFVEKVRLNESLDGVDVTVRLLSHAEPLAREGTEFWIVRPEFSLSGISGLETAVGHKYVGLIPGDPKAPKKRDFDGLAESPPDALAKEGFELIFRGARRFSVTSGSPVTFRGVEIGRVVSVELSDDMRHVDTTARIFERFHNLITTESVCWSSSGVEANLAFGSGLTVDIESLETIARGGVSVLTMSTGGAPVKSGHVFPLSRKPEKAWLEAANRF